MNQPIDDKSPNRSAYKKWLPVLVLILAILITVVLIKSRKPPVKKPFLDRGTLVEVQQIPAQDIALKVNATGTVQPRQQLRLSPQVSGKVIGLHQNFRIGGEVKKGDLLLTIDPRDYSLALTKAQNTLSGASLNYEQVANLARVARTEWQVINGTTPPPPLAAYEPQLQQAQATVKAAEADVAQAKLNLSRTKLYAPYSCRIITENVDLGQNLTTGSEIAILSGTDQSEVVIPIPIDELPWLQINQRNRNNPTPAIVSITTSAKHFTWLGEVDRILANVDEQGRMSRIVVTINAPYSTHPELPLQLGMFVDVELQGITIKDAFAVPRSAIRDDNAVWLIDSKQRLHMQAITVVRKESQQVVITGITNEDYVITSAISGAAEGMKLRLTNQPASGELQ